MVSASSWSCVTKMNVMPDVALQALELDLHLLAELEVERTQRLVEQQHLRFDDERARERHPLALAAGQLGGLAVAVGVEAYLRQSAASASSCRRALATPRTRRP